MTTFQLAAVVRMLATAAASVTWGPRHGGLLVHDRARVCQPFRGTRVP